MSDLISRQAAIEAINSHFGFNIEEEYGSAVQEVINDLPSADVVPVVHGKWIGYDDTERFTAQCGLCGNVIDTRFGSNFCPNCGAKMDAR